MSQEQEKVKLRRNLRQARSLLSAEAQQVAAKSLLNQFCKTNLFDNSQSIAAYTAFDGEIDPYLIACKAWSLQKKCYLPVLMKNDNGKEFMAFYPWHKEDILQVNHFNITEPKILDESQLVLAQDLDLIIMPMVGFDLSGNRLGMGGGFYDRALAVHNVSEGNSSTSQGLSVSCSPVRVGIAHSLQKVKFLPVNKNDQPVHFVVTDQEFYQIE